MTTSLSAVVLAGGQSSRMGRDKASLSFGDTSLLDHVIGRIRPRVHDVVVAAAAAQPVGVPDVTVVRDGLAGGGPLAAVAGALPAAAHDLVLVVAVDTPLIAPAIVGVLVAHAQGADAAVPVVNGHAQPACAVYRRPAFLRAVALSEAGAGFQEALRHMDVRWVDEAALRASDPELLSFLPCNTPEDYARAVALGAKPLPTQAASVDDQAMNSSSEEWYAFVEHVVETLDVGPGVRVFDVTAGRGRFLKPLFDNGYRVGGLSASEEWRADAVADLPGADVRLGAASTVDPADPWDVVLASDGFRDCAGADDARAMVARMVAKATHAVAILGIREDAVSGVDRAALLRWFSEAGATAVQFDTAADGRFNTFARV
ncbi:MAG: molybdenum cofactor guanylyltransferase [Acidobacteria bacterium]|nr:molybdenum cofactor guanylyltransferase [Acidobacteriota bacterium]